MFHKKFFTLPSYRSLFFGLVCMVTLISTLIYGLPSDNNQAMTISSTNFELNYTAGYAEYSGDVKLNQGSRNLEADHLYVYFDHGSKPDLSSNSDQKKIKEIKAISEKSLVHYSEKMQKETKLMHARAKIIKLIPNKDLLTLEQQASIEQNNRQLTSDLLHYNTRTEVAYSPMLGNKRTKLTLG